MKTEELYSLIQDQRGSASARGITFYKQAATCGRAARLGEEYREAKAAAEAAAEQEDDGLSPLATGTYFHKLHEVALRGQLEDEVWDMTADVDKNFVEALRLFRGYQANWGSPLLRWGATLVGTEVALEGDIGGPITGRADLIIDIYDVETVKRNTGLDLPGPGRYILDFKTAKGAKPMHEWEFRFSLQAAAYMRLYNVTHPDTPVRGFVFDMVYKHKNLIKEPKLDKKGKLSQGASYGAFYQEATEDNLGAVESLVQLGKYNYDNNIANPSACFAGYKPCWFFTQGKCGRR